MTLQPVPVAITSVGLEPRFLVAPLNGSAGFCVSGRDLFGAPLQEWGVVPVVTLAKGAQCPSEKVPLGLRVISGIFIRKPG